MTPHIERHTDARRINEIVNDPSVYPMVHGYSDGPIDLGGIIEMEETLALVGEHGSLVFVQFQPGIWEVHSQCLPEGRGEWMLAFTNGCLKWAFCKTAAMEILTRCPKGNAAAVALAKRIGGRLDFTNPQGWVKDKQTIPADIYSLTVQDWMRTAPDLEWRGEWFRTRLALEFERLGYSLEQDASYDRHVGAALEMVFGGQPDKAVALFNRGAFLADRAPISIVAREPLTIDIGAALLIMRDNDFWVATVAIGA